MNWAVLSIPLGEALVLAATGTRFRTVVWTGLRASGRAPLHQWATARQTRRQPLQPASPGALEPVARPCCWRPFPANARLTAFTSTH